MNTKLDKILALAEKGATEGERNAAKVAAKRITDRNVDALIAKAEEKAKGTIYTKVVFLMAQNPYTDMWEPMAYFPDLYWDVEKKMNTSYMHNGQHGPCCEAFALLDCIAPKRQHMKAVERLKCELEHLDEPYSLTVLDSDEWIKSHGKRRVEIDSAVRSLTSTVSVAEQLAKWEEDQMAAAVA